MNKYLTIAASAALLLVGAVGTTIPARAQAAAGTTAASGPFQDVPADHWAYSAVNTLQKAGIVIGYPDGTYGGRRAMTRYEFAEAIARLLPQINNIDTSQFAKQSDLLAFETDTNGKLATDEAAISALQALVDEFQPELKQLGTDVDAIKRRLDSDEDRLAAVEAEQKRVKITGDVNFIARDFVNTNDHDAPFLDQNGYRAGNNNLNGQFTGSSSFWEAPSFVNDVLLTIDGKVSDTSSVVVKIDATDYTPEGGSYDSLLPSSDGDLFDDGVARPSFASFSSLGFGNSEAFDIFRAYYDSPVNIGIDSNADLQVGRLDEQFTPLTLKAEVPDVYVSLPEDNTGNVGVDGAKINFSAGPVKVNAYAGKTDTDKFTTLTAVSPGAAGFYFNEGASNAQVTQLLTSRPGSIIGGGVEPTVGIDQSAGAHVTFGASSFNIGATAILARVDDGSGQGSVDTWNTTKVDNTLGVYGANVNGTIPGVSGLGIDAEFAISQTGHGSQFGNNNSDHGNEAYNANLAYTFAGVGLKAGYEAIYNAFEAPGYWGKIGSWTNPTNVQGAVLSASYAATPALNLSASGNILQGLSNTKGLSPLDDSEDIDSAKVDAKYAFSSAYNVDLGYEWVEWKLKANSNENDLTKNGSPTEQYINIGFGHPFNANATLKLLYQIDTYGDNGTHFDPDGSTNGGVAVSQLEVKF
jgi:hypothetical protein